MHPVLLRLGGTIVSSYDVLVALGYLVGTAYLCTQIPGRWMAPRRWWVLAAVLFGGYVLGGKAAFFIVEWKGFAADPWGMLKDWDAGWVFWGGLLTAILFGRFYQAAHNRLYPHEKIPYLPIADYFGAALPMGHWLGRIGCFMEGCCHGRPADLPWAVRFTSPAASVSEELIGVPLHPVQLYESAGVLAICLCNLLLVLPRIRAGKLRPGTAFLVYLTAYAVLRFFLEFWRGDERGTFLWPALSPGQWMSLGVFLVCGTWLWRRGIWLDAAGPATSR